MKLMCVISSNGSKKHLIDLETPISMKCSMGTINNNEGKTKIMFYCHHFINIICHSIYMLRKTVETSATGSTNVV